MRARGWQDGQAVLMVVVVMLILQLIAGVFLARMNAEQRVAGRSARSLAALYLAEAALQRALVMLEQGPPADAASEGLLLPYHEALGAGVLTIETIDQRPDGLIAVVVRGEVAGTIRRVQALVRLGPEALGYGIYAREAVSLEGRSRTYVLQGRGGWGERRGRAAIATDGEMRLDRPVALNVFSGRAVPMREGEGTDQTLRNDTGSDAPSPLVDLIFTGEPRLRVGLTSIPPRLEDLREHVGEIAVRRITSRTPVAFPAIDMEFFRRQAETNTANAALNAAAGVFGGYPDLRAKAHSRYSAEDLVAILNYLARSDQRGAALRGVIFVYGPLELRRPGRLTIVDGALIVNGDLTIGNGVTLDVRHGPEAQRLPALIATAVERAQLGSIQIEQGGAAFLDGVVFAEGNVEVLGGVLDIVGAIAARNFVNASGLAMVRRHAAAPATLGIRAAGSGTTVVTSWRELP
jgi:hypothetical protein